MDVVLSTLCNLLLLHQNVMGNDQYGGQVDLVEESIEEDPSTLQLTF